MLEKISSPADVKRLKDEELPALADEIRKTIITVVSENGGHLASNLGIVEATIAVHRVFDSPNDTIIFDVGHQCYAHKLLTGRYERFKTLRSYGGISGFTDKAESPYDAFNEGHCGTSISTALGVAVANGLKGSDAYTIAVVGDGAFTNGMIYEALNNCGGKKLKLIILLNDNEMSISKNTGSLHNYLSRIRTSKGYFNLKHGIQKIFSHIPLIGGWLVNVSRKTKDYFKRFLVKDTIFENLGVDYLGPVDGNNIEKLTDVLCEAKIKGTCCLVHMITKKGAGCEYAEEYPDRYHSVGRFDITTGALPKADMTFSSRTGEILCARAKTDASLCAITAAMCEGTGLTDFSKQYPGRFFDVGIAEEHAVAFCGGLSDKGMKPVCVLYSTFAQRVFDQAFHDIAVQKVPMILALDRCGLVPGDGITHQGIFDYPLFSSIPGVVIYSPETYEELDEAFNEAFDDGLFSIIRYPKGKPLTYNTAHRQIKRADLCCTENVLSADVVIITYGRITKIAFEASAFLSDKYNTGVIKLKKVMPIDFKVIAALTSKAKLVYILEEGIMSGGAGEKIASHLSGANGADIYIHAINGFVGHGDPASLYREQGFEPEQIARRIEEQMQKIKADIPEDINETSDEEPDNI